MGGRGSSARPAANTTAAAASSAVHARRREKSVTAPSSRIHAAISARVHGRGSTVAQGSAAARVQVDSKSQSPAPASFAAAGAANGSHASAAHSAKPPASRGPDNGTRTRFASGPTSDARPNTAIHSGHNAAAIAAEIKNNATAARARPGQVEGAARSAADPAQMIAAQAPTLMTALGDSADAGSTASMTAAAKVSAAEAVVSRPHARAVSAPASMTQARTHGGSEPVISV